MTSTDRALLLALARKALIPPAEHALHLSADEAIRALLEAAERSAAPDTATPRRFAA